PDNLRTRLDLQWPVYTGGRLDALERAARAEAAASAADVEQARADLRFEIKRQYWALVTAREAITVLEGSRNQTAAHLRDVRNQLDAGLVPPKRGPTPAPQERRRRWLRVRATPAQDATPPDPGRLAATDPDP